MITKESLGIYWTFEEYNLQVKKSNFYQEEVDGIIFYGYWNRELPKKLLALSDFIKLWLNSEIEVKLRKYDSVEYNCYSLEVRIIQFPNCFLWKKTLKNSLNWFNKQGAIVSWCGDEYSNALIDIFDSKLASGNVYAAYNSKVGFICNSSLNQEYQDLTDEQLLEFKNSLL